MLLHFIFVIKEEELDERKQEFEYVKQMANFFQIWIKEKFAKDFEIKCDEMVTQPRSILQKLDTHVLQRDHRERGQETYHFYLTHFRPIWTDCAGCEGFHSENFGMALWQKPKVQKVIQNYVRLILSRLLGTQQGILGDRPLETFATCDGRLGRQGCTGATCLSLLFGSP